MWGPSSPSFFLPHSCGDGEGVLRRTCHPVGVGFRFCTLSCPSFFSPAKWALLGVHLIKNFTQSTLSSATPISPSPGLSAPGLSPQLPPFLLELCVKQYRGFFFCPCQVACGVLVLHPGTEIGLLAVRVWSSNLLVWVLKNSPSVYPGSL